MKQINKTDVLKTWTWYVVDPETCGQNDNNRAIWTDKVIISSNSNIIPSGGFLLCIKKYNMLLTIKYNF